MAKIWVKTSGISEGKFLVVRRDGSIPCWPHFVLGARDPAAPAALRAYADAFIAHSVGRSGDFDRDYVESIKELANDFDRYRTKEGDGDPEVGPHRKDDPDIIKVMRGDDGFLALWHESHNIRKATGV